MSDHAPQKDQPKKPNPKTDADEPEYEDDELDDALEDTFPASDPVAPQDPGRPGKG